ncbi:hypothetical protein Shyd_68560 [Streptomyces hydrogenans]|uniref:HTH marR-type domain-containing protein n=1 Tax=Streptomyces hydrogenans TaxID=1873719 RepID=A0ABQ3PKD7_9ACTN|nr:hypothetical protein Shyd_68560 [Streptomyces hydrogenans]
MIVGQQAAGWGFLTNHARVLLVIARDPAVRIRDIAAACRITERAAQRIVGDLEEAVTSAENGMDGARTAPSVRREGCGIRRRPPVRGGPAGVVLR